MSGTTSHLPPPLHLSRLSSPCQIPPGLLSMKQKALEGSSAEPFEETAMTTTTFAKPPQNSIATALQVFTVVVALLLGAAFTAGLVSDRAEEGLRAALGPVAAEQVRS